MATILAFRTPVGSYTIPAGKSVEIGKVDVSPFRQIRLVADERESDQRVTLSLDLL